MASVDVRSCCKTWLSRSSLPIVIFRRVEKTTETTYGALFEIYPMLHLRNHESRYRLPNTINVNGGSRIIQSGTRSLATVVEKGPEMAPVRLDRNGSQRLGGSALHR